MDKVIAKNFVNLIARLLEDYKDVDMATKVKTLEDLFSVFTIEEINEMQEAADDLKDSRNSDLFSAFRLCTSPRQMG